jgi:hypothetical protein
MIMGFLHITRVSTSLSHAYVILGPYPTICRQDITLEVTKLLYHLTLLRSILTFKGQAQRPTTKKVIITYITRGSQSRHANTLALAFRLYTTTIDTA